MKYPLHTIAIVCMFIPNTGMADHMGGTLNELMFGETPRPPVLALPPTRSLPPVDTRMTPAPGHPQRLSPSARRHLEWQRDYYRSDKLRR